jgi:hypothetical protein
MSQKACARMSGVSAAQRTWARPMPPQPIRAQLSGVGVLSIGPFLKGVDFCVGKGGLWVGLAQIICMRARESAEAWQKRSIATRPLASNSNKSFCHTPTNSADWEGIGETLREGVGRSLRTSGLFCEGRKSSTFRWRTLLKGCGIEDGKALR